MTETMQVEKEIFYLTLSCRNQPGIVAAVAVCLFKLGGNIIDAQQFDDLSAQQFFMRVEFDIIAIKTQIRAAFEPIAASFQMPWELRDKRHARRVLILVSKLDHCLGDLLYRR